jgi:hypothetical protein
MKRQNVISGLVGAALVGCGTAWAVRWLRSTFHPPVESGKKIVGAHACLVPTSKSQREARWTRHALVHSSESHTI